MVLLGTAVLERKFWRGWVDFYGIGGGEEGGLTVDVHRVILQYLKLPNPFGALQPAGFPPGP